GPGLAGAVIPQLAVHVPTTPEHGYHDGLAIGFVGRLVPEKGLDTLLQALGEMRALRWRLIVVGDGPDRERLERLATELRLAARVRWLGSLPADEVPKVWPDLDVLVLPSRALATWAEPAAHVVAEAMAQEGAAVGTSGELGCGAGPLRATAPGSLLPAPSKAMTRVLLVPDLPLERWPSMDRYAHRLYDWLESADPGFEVRLAASIGDITRELGNGRRHSGGYPRWWAQDVDPIKFVL